MIFGFIELTPNQPMTSLHQTNFSTSDYASFRGFTKNLFWRKIYEAWEGVFSLFATYNTVLIICGFTCVSLVLYKIGKNTCSSNIDINQEG